MFSPLEKNIATEKVILKTDNAFKRNKISVPHILRFLYIILYSI